MKTILWILLGTLASIIISLFFEEGREWWEEVWEYLSSFEWLEDFWEFITGMFDDMGEFSIGGLVFGIAVFIFVYVLREYMLQPFLVHMSPGAAMFWSVVNYAGCAMVGYLVGKKIFGDD